MQTLDLVNSVSDTLEDCIKFFFLNNFSSSVQDEIRIWSYIVLNLEQMISRVFVKRL